VNALGVVGGYWLLRELLGDKLAVFGAALWALDPYMSAHSGILHIDSLSTTFATLALLSALVATNRDRLSGWVAFVLFAGACTGLAALAKFSLFFMLGMAPLALLIAGWERGPRVALVRAIGGGLLMALAAAAIFYAVYPGMWTAPNLVFERTWYGITERAFVPHENGTFFLGQPTDDPGWLYYPVVLLFRSTPLTVIGVLALVFTVRQLPAETQQVVWALLVHVVLFTVFMALQDKKLDRYILPAVPTLTIIAAIGLGLAFHQLTSRDGLLRWGVVGLLGLQLALLFPYELAYYNLLVGGNRVAERTLMLGWGEGHGPAMAFIQAAEGEDCVSDVAVADPPTLQRHLPYGCELGGTQVHIRDGSFRRLDTVDWVVVYVRSRQRDPELAAFFEDIPPAYVFTLFGVDYTRVYRAEDIQNAS
jgi:4-amino-4-deoxy-L-arabinose transferase-like glycosyltransferase